MTQYFPSQIAPTLCIDFHLLVPESLFTILLRLCMAAKCSLTAEEAMDALNQLPASPGGSSSC